MKEILSQSIFFGIAITLVTYEIGLWIKQKTGKAIANPLLISVILIVAVLLLFHIDYETYANGAQYISIFLTPATVSLAVPLYRQLEFDVPEIYLLGDAKKVSNIMYGIWDAFEVANHI